MMIIPFLNVLSEGIFLWNALNPRVQAEKAGSSIL